MRETSLLASRPRRSGRRTTRYTMRVVALAYLTFLIGIPVALVFKHTFANGVRPVVHALSDHDVLHAFRVTAIVSLWAVVLNTVFGVGVALLLVRHRFPGRRLLSVIVSLPMAVSPVVVGLALILVYGKFQPVGGWLQDHGVQVIFALPGMVLATAFVSLPLVVREVAPVLEEIGTEQEQAAWTLGAGSWSTFRRITLPAIRWALVYGVVLTLARSIGEYGAVAVVSGRLIGRTQTATQLVDDRFQNFDETTAYAVSVTLALVAMLVLVATNLIRPASQRAVRATRSTTKEQ